MLKTNGKKSEKNFHILGSSEYYDKTILTKQTKKQGFRVVALKKSKDNTHKHYNVEQF